MDTLYRRPKVAKKRKPMKTMKRKDESIQTTNQMMAIQPFDRLPVELLDMILRKSYLLCVLSKAESIYQRDKDIICVLASVSYSWFQWVTDKRFKRSIWRHLEVFYEETKKTVTILRNNRNYFMENILPGHEFIDMLKSLNCLKEDQLLFIKRLTFPKDKNEEILRIIGSVDETGHDNFIRCLRRTKQRNVTKVVETGGVVLKATIILESQKSRTEAQISAEILNDILKHNKESNRQTKRLITQLELENIYILSSSIDKEKHIILWIWCQSQISMENLREMFHSSRLQKTLKDLFNSISSRSDFSKGIKLDIGENQFQRYIVVRPTAVSFDAKLKIEEAEEVCGVTKLQNRIHVLCRYGRPDSNCIFIFMEDYSFHFQKRIEVSEIKIPWDIVSSTKENCLYISDKWNHCIWRLKETEKGSHQLDKWLTNIYGPLTMSMSSDGLLLLSSFGLLSYGPDADLRHSIQLPSVVEGLRLLHAVETSKGNFIISYGWNQRENKEDEEENESQSKGREKYGITEVTSDGKTIREVIPTDGNQKMIYPLYLSLNSYDQLIVADRRNNRVILLDADFKWNRIIRLTEDDEEEGRKICYPSRFCYDKEKKQLVVGGKDKDEEERVYVYTLNWK